MVNIERTENIKIQKIKFGRSMAHLLRIEYVYEVEGNSQCWYMAYRNFIWKYTQYIKI